ncbi:MAG: UDP-2,3-diacylglucosamine diphosphatase [bacterium]|nr:UDP-2,3-diacylglucosamine diphosphatase [bacterium]
MSVAVIADCHLGGPGGDAEPLIEQLEELPEQGCRHLLLLGDVFHVWVGRRSFQTPMIRRVLETLRRLGERGIRIDYIEGNRDFFIAKSPYSRLFQSVGTELTFEAGGVSYLAVHGDGLNDRDRQYLFWRWLSKSLPSRWAMAALPPPIARWMTSSVEESLSKTNFKHKMEIPKEAILRYAAPRLGEGHDVLLLGHFHEPRTWATPGGEVRIVDAWFNNHHIEWLS